MNPSPAARLQRSGLTWPGRTWPGLPALLATCAALVVALLAYWPGLQGEFVFDDFANLPALGRYGGIHDWQSLTWYLTSGVADPTGRPVSLLSFLIDARNWPADPYPFKRTNLVIHLLNGALLYGLLARLGQWLQLAPAKARWAAACGAALWLLHPLWTSTVLYVIQRQAMLATLFVLLGLHGWLAARQAFARGHTAAGWGWAILAVPVMGLLAGLSKANGFLLPLLVTVLEVTVLSTRAPVLARAPGLAGARVRTHARAAAWLLGRVPAVLLLAGIVAEGVRAAPGMPGQRGWTLGQRLLTQPRVLLDYLHLLLLPGPQTRGVFADTFPVSSDWLHPWTTLPAGLAMAAAAGLAFKWRHRRPALSAAVLFFLAAHVMESSFIALELYFEHRNYLPAVLLFWPIALWLYGPGKALTWRRCAMVALPLLFATLTALQAQLWSDPRALAQTWAHVNPASARAQSYAAAVDLQAGHTQAAIARLTPLVAASPHEIQYTLNLVDAYCHAGRVPLDALARAQESLRKSGVGADLAYRWLADIMTPGSHDPCAGLPLRTRERLLDAGLARAPYNSETQGRHAYLAGLGALARGACPQAVEAFRRRLQVQNRPEFLQQQTILLATQCGPGDALALLDDPTITSRPWAPAATPAMRLRDTLMQHDGYWQAEWTRLRKVLRDDLAHAQIPEREDVRK